MRHWRLASIAAMLALLITTTSALAGGNGATTFTETAHQETTVETDDSGDVCGLTGEVTTTVNSVFHITMLNNGTTHVTGTATGTFTFEADNGVTYTGRFTQWFGENDNRSNSAATFTFTVRGVGTDGSTVGLHETAHVSVSATGHVLEFDKVTATCP